MTQAAQADQRQLQSRPRFPKPPELSLKRPKGRIDWFLSRSAYARLFRDFETFRAELGLRTTPSAEQPDWYLAAQHQLETVEKCLQKKDIEGGWHALHAAQRFVIFGLTPDELIVQRICLLTESKKLSSWRGDAIREILAPSDSATASRISEAMTRRDEESANKYHKIWLIGDQLTLVMVACAIGVLAYLLVIGLIGPKILEEIPEYKPDWTVRSVNTVCLFGLFGGAYSTLRGLLQGTPDVGIPERVANYFVTVARLVAGVLAGLAGYAFWAAGLVPMFAQGRAYSPAALSIAFLFGYIGEFLVARVAQTIEKDKG